MSEATNPFPETNNAAKNKDKDGRTDWSSPHHYEDRHKRFPAQETLIGSYLHQQYRFQSLELKPSKTRTKNHNLYGVILTAWNPFGKPTNEAENLELNNELKAHLEKRNLKAEPILTLASNFRWLEDAYLVEDLTFEQAEDIATAFGQLAFITLHGNKATLRLTTNASFMGLPRDFEEMFFLDSKEVTYNHCPARYPANDDKQCTMVGGPFGSAAIHAAGIWGTTRKQFVSRLGCNPCQTPPTPRDGAILVYEPDMPSRFGGFQWASQPTILG